MKQSTLILPDTFEPSKHWYPKALNATIHPMVAFFLNLSQERIVQRYCHLNPMVKPDDLMKWMKYQPKYFYWAGTDLIHVTSEQGKRQMVVIETNSCPSGQKSMPLLDDNLEMGGYEILMRETFKPLLKNRRLPEGDLAVIYDKNPMEASGYVAAMASVFQEQVHFIPLYNQADEQNVRLNEAGVLEFVDEAGYWKPLRAVFRYLTQKPWNRLPVKSKTFIFNPIIACLAGGRNKMVASKAYEFFNAELAESNLKIFTPETIWDVSKNEIPLWVQKMGGQAVVKIPYSNAGQGVYTIVNQQELDNFMAKDYEYDQFIVQSLIGNYWWSSNTQEGKFYHVGTMPDKKGESFAADVRMMLRSTKDGFKPLSIYARKAASPLLDHLESGADSWKILGTNLSVKLDQNQWSSDTDRLLLMDRRDFNRLGVGLDDLIQGFIQTLLATIAIDKMAINFIGTKGALKRKLFRSLNNDQVLMNEIMAIS